MFFFIWCACVLSRKVESFWILRMGTLGFAPFLPTKPRPTLFEQSRTLFVSRRRPKKKNQAIVPVIFFFPFFHYNFFFSFVERRLYTDFILDMDMIDRAKIFHHFISKSSSLFYQHCKFRVQFQFLILIFYKISLFRHSNIFFLLGF